MLTRLLPQLAPRLSRFRLLLALSSVLAAAPGLYASGPAWWVTRGVLNGNPADDYSLVNQGQLKHMAAEARNELNSFLTGGAGPAIDSLVNGWSNSQTADDFAVCNLGQLKAISKLYWDRLVAEGYATSADYPWTLSTADDDDYAAANLGQLKTLFAVSADRDNDGLPDNWELQYAGSLGILSGDGVHDADGDGIPDLTEFRMGWNPMSNDLNDATKAESFTYDGAHRLTGVTGRNSRSYTPDANANLTQAQ